MSDADPTGRALAPLDGTATELWRRGRADDLAATCRVDSSHFAKRQAAWRFTAKLVAVSPSGRRACVGCRGVGADVRLDIWRLPELRLERSLRVGGTSGMIWSRTQGFHVDSLRALVFVDEDTLLIGTTHGACVASLEQASGIVETTGLGLSGANVEFVGRVAGHVVVSVFPTLDGPTPNSSLGVHLYSTEQVARTRSLGVPPQPPLYQGQSSRLPLRVTGSPDGARLRMRGCVIDDRSGERRYRGWVDGIDRTGRARRLLYERAGLSVTSEFAVSPPDPVGRFVIADDRAWVLHSAAEDEIERMPGVELGVKNVILMPGDRAVGRCTMGRLAAWDIGRTPPTSHDGPRFEAIRRVDDQRLLGALSKGDQYELALLDAADLRVVRRSSNGQIRPALKRGCAFGPGAQIALATDRGRLALLARPLALQRAAALPDDSVVELVLVPGEDALAASSDSGGQSWVTADGAVRPAADGGFSQRLTVTPEGQLYRGSASRNDYAWLPGGLLWSLHGAGSVTRWRQTPGGTPDETLSSQVEVGRELRLPFRRVGGCALHGRVLVLSGDGRLAAFDPEQLGEVVEGEPLRLDPPHARILRSDIAAPRGLALLADGRVALWTAKQVELLRYDAELRVESRVTLAAAEARNVQLDPLTGRIFTTHANHLTVWGAREPGAEELEPWLRLYLIAGGGLLTHALYPAELQPDHKAKHKFEHPGFFSFQAEGEDGQCLGRLAGLLEVLDAAGQPVRHAETRLKLLHPYARHRLVQDAARDYPAFAADQSGRSKRLDVKPAPLALTTAFEGDR
jgi:hypothetical protein